MVAGPTEPLSGAGLSAVEAIARGSRTDPPSREHLRDLAALLALPRMWRGRTPVVVTRSLLDVLVSLLRLDAGFVRVAGEPGEAALVACRPVDLAASTIQSWTDASASRSGVAQDRLGEQPIRLLRVESQVDSAQALVIGGSLRADFPTELDSFLCRIAVEQAMLAINTERLVERLRQANSTKSTFLATMSHELRTPLNAIIGYSDLLRAGIGGSLSDQQTQHIHRIDSASRHLLELIEGILGYARLEAGKEKVYVSDLSARDIAEGVLALVDPLARRKQLDLVADLAGADFRMRTDVAKVRQILLNLLSNALNFTTGGTIALRVERVAQDSVWTVSDTGVGIAQANLDVIFEPFRQVAEARTARAPGTGLGLTVSRQLARLLGGDITVSSEVGHGSRFVVRLPTTMSGESEPHATTSVAPPA